MPREKKSWATPKPPNRSYGLIGNHGTVNSKPWAWDRNMFGNRREFLAATAAGLSASAFAGDSGKPSTAMGVVLDSYAVRMRVGKSSGFSDPLKFVAFCRE